MHIVHWVWLGIALAAAAPLGYIAALLNPLVYFTVGPERWRDQMQRAWPYRWWFGLGAAIAAFAFTMFAISG